MCRLHSTLQYLPPHAPTPATPTPPDSPQVSGALSSKVYAAAAAHGLSGAAPAASKAGGDPTTDSLNLDSPLDKHSPVPAGA